MYAEKEKTVIASHGQKKGFDTMIIAQTQERTQLITLKDWALMYARQGWPVFPLVQNGKTPLTKRGFKDATTDANQIEAWWSQWPNANIGLPTGEAFDVLDFDLNLSGSKGNPHPEVWGQYGQQMLDNPVVRTRNGYHVYFTTTGIGNRAQIGPDTGERSEKGKAIKACDWRGHGGYVVAPPSVWEDGSGIYTWLSAPKDKPLQDVPPMVMDWLTRKKTAAPSKAPEPSIRFEVVGGDERQLAAYFSRAVEGICSDMSNAVEGERNHTLFTCACRLFELLNGSCGRLDGAIGAEQQLWSAASSVGLSESEINQTFGSARNKVGNFGVEPDLKPTQDTVSFMVQGETDDRATWEHKLFRFPDKKDGTQGGLMAVSSNVKTILTHDKRWIGKVVHNEFSRKVEKLERIPSETGNRHGDGIWTESDDAEFSDWLAHNYGVHYKDMGEMRRGILAAALTRNYHPVRQYLNSLKWDGRERLTEVPGRLFSCESPEYAGKVFRWWMLAAVKRIFEPGCKADYAIILEGAQGIGKSTILAILGGDWFSDSPIDMTSKDAYCQTIGTWIVEIPELSGFSKTDDTRAKSFFSERAPRVRLPFRRDAENIPRECVFAGTTNENDYLKDSTGNRRYWPIKCGVNGPIQLAELQKRRDQLWAEAVEMIRRGERYYPTTDEENAILTLQQSVRTLDDAWSYPVQSWLRNSTSTIVIPSDVFKGALDKPIGTVTTGDSRRLAAILKKLGYESARVTMDGKKVTVYKVAGGTQLPTLDSMDNMPDESDDIPW